MLLLVEHFICLISFGRCCFLIVQILVGSCLSYVFVNAVAAVGSVISSPAPFT